MYLVARHIFSVVGRTFTLQYGRTFSLHLRPFYDGATLHRTRFSPLLHGPVHNHFHHHGITSTITNMNIIVKISLRWHAIKDIFSALAPLMLIVLKIFFRLSKPYLFLSGSADLKEETHEEICLNKRKPRRGDKSDI